MKSDGETGLPVASMRSVYVMVLRARANTRVVVKPSLLNIAALAVDEGASWIRGFVGGNNQTAMVEGELVGGMT